ncbi:MAG: leucyl/phenylalanyl-tRNA--protein transferase [Leptospiraceae bacterium]|nr:leucyl/phenylalanyl-tRNA--protein transferase [Leptospiraceae bacterium]MCP5503212.1 leucyl/phenylalanyl-tRNA--protein transferase [Leptospiraceae bacterium]
MRDFESFFGNPSMIKSDMVAIGGDFSTERLFYAYSHGIFPWSQNPIRWYCLNPRAIFDIKGLHISRTVKRKIKKGLYTITFNEAFTDVMKGCALRVYEPTWISKGFIEGYTNFHRDGYAHSVEAWDSYGNLVGGAYGVAIGKFFAGESMFSFSSDAGKVALSYLFSALDMSGFTLFDTQQLNEVTWNLGAYEIPKSVYLSRLKDAVKVPTKWQPPLLEQISPLDYAERNS